MKILLAIVFALFCLNTFAYEIQVGAIANYHYMTNFPKLRNKLTNNGRLVLSPYFLELKHKNFSVFTSRDCLNLPIVGGLYSKDIFKKGRFSIDFVVGGYLINKKEWSEVSRTYWLNGGIVPLVGGVSTLEVFKNKDFSVNFKTSVFPLIIQNGVFLKKEF